MRKYLKRSFIVLFLTMLVAPNVFFPFIQKWVDTENYENRELAVKPNLGECAIEEYPQAFEDYFNDHLPFKNQIRTINSAMKVLVFHSLDSDKVLLGKNGWLFYKAEGCIEDYRGVRSYSEEELEEIKKNMLKIQQWFDERGIEVVVNIVPNKCEVYDMYMPDNISVKNPVSETEQAVIFLNNEVDMPIIYDINGLKERSKEYQIYYKYDTHWNYIGGYYGAKTICEALGKQVPDISSTDIVKQTNDVFPIATQQSGSAYDLSMMISLPKVLDTSKDKRYLVNYKPDIKFEYETMASYSDVDTAEYISNAEDTRHVIMIGDSFSNLNIPYLAKEFQKCSQIGYGHYDNNFITSRTPDIVIFQFVERRAVRFDRIIMSILEREEV